MWNLRTKSEIRTICSRIISTRMCALREHIGSSYLPPTRRRVAIWSSVVNSRHRAAFGGKSVFSKLCGPGVRDPVEPRPSAMKPCRAPLLSTVGRASWPSNSSWSSVSPLGALAASDQATDERKGRTIVQINYATCHAVRRQGDSPDESASFPRSAQAIPCRKPSGGARGRNCYWSRRDAGVQVRAQAGGRDHRLPEETGTPMTSFEGADALHGGLSTGRRLRA
jgi:hypothetical protein